MDPAASCTNAPPVECSNSAIEPKNAAPATHITANTNAAGGSPKNRSYVRPSTIGKRADAPGSRGTA